MNVAFRADASFAIGSGHLMRCLTLADALKQRNASTCFVCRHIPDGMKSMIKQKGHQLVHIDGTQSAPETIDNLMHSAWLGINQMQDAIDTVQALSGQSWDWIVADHYALDERWESLIRRSETNVMAIDDIADRQHDCQVLLDQNLYTNMERRYADKVPADCRLLLGPHYALLRDEFRILRDRVQPRTGPVQRVFVFFGGVDAVNCTAKAIEAVAGLAHVVQADIVIGAQHPDREAIERACAMHGYQCHVQTDQMATLMLEADIAIGASGSASWERCCMGLPSVCITLADNQIGIAKSLDAYGACVLIGDGASVSATSLRESLSSLVGDGERLHAMSVKASSLVDGGGADRVADILYGYG